MSAGLYICLVLLTTIAANDSTTSKHESLKYIVYNQENIKKFGTGNGTNSTGYSERPQIGGQDKNVTEQKKPVLEKEGMDTESSQVVISYPPYGSYEVTEDVLDIPDDRTPAGPIVTNYAGIPPPLNLGKPNNKTEKDKVTENNVNYKKNRISILHINAEFDNKETEVNGHKAGIFKGIKDYIKGFHRGIVNGIHSFFHKHDDVNGHGERFESRAADREVGHGEW